MLAALQHLKSLQPLATEMGSAELRQLGQDVLRKSLFAARLNLINVVDDLKLSLADYLAGDTNLATAKQDLLDSLRKYGYQPETGFPAETGAVGNVPPAEPGSLQDLSSDDRLKLIVQTNFRQALNYAKREAGMAPDALEQFPAWELLRLYPRMVPRGERRTAAGLVPVPGDDWPSRWHKAAGLAADNDALRVAQQTGRLIARKDSTIWDVLGDPGVFEDAIGTNYPPFAFNSGFGWSAVARAECITVGLIGESTRIAPRPESFAAGLTKDAASTPLADLRATRAALLAAAQALRGGAA